MAMGKKYEEAILLIGQIDGLINATKELIEGEKRIFPAKNAEITLMVAALLRDHMSIVARYYDEDYG